MDINKEFFGAVNGRPINAYTISTEKGMSITFLDYGCIIQKLIVPDKEGVLENIVLGFDTIEEYAEHSPYFGAVVGRVAGRIRDGKFTLDGQEYHLAKNSLGHHLHGGIKGLDRVIWEAEIRQGNRNEGTSLIFTYQSFDGEEGYPGNVSFKTVYTVTEHSELRMEFFASTDKRTLVNMTNHTYFNLNGEAKATVLNHSLKMDSDRFLELDQEMLPTGETLSVEGTPFDFRQEASISAGRDSKHPQNVLAGQGYDHPFLLPGNKDKIAIKLSCAETGRVMEISTNQPCAVLYTTSGFNDDFLIYGKVKPEPYLAVCLETQNYPDAINHPGFPSVILEKDDEYYAYTNYSFKCE